MILTALLALGGPTECLLDFILEGGPPPVEVGESVTSYLSASFEPGEGTMTTPDGVVHDLVFTLEGDFYMSQNIEYVISGQDGDIGSVVWLADATHASGTPQCRTGWATNVVQGQLCGDVDGDGAIDTSDLLFVISNWGSDGPFGDTNDDGAVDIWDLINVMCNWGGAESGCYPL